VAAAQYKTWLRGSARRLFDFDTPHPAFGHRRAGRDFHGG